MTRLQYADDTIIFCPPKIDQLLNIKKFLIIFQLASGLQINFHKSFLYGIHTDETWLNSAANSLKCTIGKLPFSYQGLPMGGSSSKLATWDPIIKRIEDKMATFDVMAGRLTLIKASISSLPMYYMSLFPVPKGIIEKINKLQRLFLWSGGSSAKPYLSLASWSLLELPKKLGGLGCGNILHRNLSLLFQWVWRFLHEPNSLWHEIISHKYGYDRAFIHHELTAPSHGGPWRNICASILKHPGAKNLLQYSIRRMVGNGANALFWLDQWLGNFSLKHKFPRLFLISSNPNATISSCGFWVGHTWKWNLKWCRNLRSRDLEEWNALQLLLSPVCLSTKEKDSFSWTMNKRGDFSVKSMSTALVSAPSQSVPPYANWMKIWRGVIPPKVELFTWLSIRGKKNTRAKLARLNIIAADASLCPLCQSH